MAVFLALGGDHGQGAFWLCFRALLTVKGVKMPYYKTKLIAEIYCKKEEGTILDESITPWMNEDLKQIKDSLLEVRSGSDGVTCDWRAKVLPPTNIGEVSLVCVHRMLTSDLCFVAYTFGKEGGSGHY